MHSLYIRFSAFGVRDRKSLGATRSQDVCSCFGLHYVCTMFIQNTCVLSLYSNTCVLHLYVYFIHAQCTHYMYTISYTPGHIWVLRGSGP